MKVLWTSERRKELIAMYDAGTAKTDIADHFGVSRERIRQVYEQSLRWMRSGKFDQRTADLIEWHKKAGAI